MALSAAATSSCSNAQISVSGRGVQSSLSSIAQRKALGAIPTKLSNRRQSSLSVRAAAHEATWAAAPHLASGTSSSGATGPDVRVAALRRALNADSPPARPAYVSMIKRTSAGLIRSDDHKQVVDFVSGPPNTSADWTHPMDFYAAHSCGGYCDYQI